MESGLIPSSRITASTTLDADHQSFHGRLGTILGKGAWCSDDQNGQQFLQVELEAPYRIMAFAIQGKHPLSDDAIGLAWVTTYSVSIKQRGGRTWKFINNETNTTMVFAGNTEHNLTVKNVLSKPFTAKSIRVHPVTWYNKICLRLELYGSPGPIVFITVDNCQRKIGIEMSGIYNDSLKASSSLGPDFRPWFARLNGRMGGGAWCSRVNDKKEFLQVNLPHLHNISAVIIQGRAGKEEAWVTKLSVEYSLDGNRWERHSENNSDNYLKLNTQVFNGNTASDSVAEIILTSPIYAKYIRLRPVQWHTHVCMRVELRGCPGKTFFPLGMSIYKIPDSAITASSYTDPYTRPEMARLHSARGHGAWCADANDSSPYIQVDLKTPHRLGFVSTQGQLDKNSWVQKFTISYRLEDQDWEPYGQAFSGNIDANTVVKNALNKSIEARFIRIHPVSWNRRACTRLEIYG
ncbi:predicted protein, partial [Nematostella vectensis]